MKRIISIILIILFLNLWLSPYEFSYGKFFNNKQMLASTVIKNNYLQEKLPEMNHQVIAGGVMAAGGAIAGFTLAEVMISMVVIGVVAVLIVPAIAQRIQKDSYKIKFKEVFSQIDQATRKMALDYGGLIPDGACPSNSNCSDSDCMRNLFGNYLTFVRTNQCNQSIGNTWAYDVKTYYGPSVYGWWSNTYPLNAAYGGGATGVLPNGATLYFYLAYSRFSIKEPTIYVDVNGMQDPNQLGVDIFVVKIGSFQAYPHYDQNDCRNTDLYGTGTGCAAKVIMNRNY